MTTEQMDAIGNRGPQGTCRNCGGPYHGGTSCPKRPDRGARLRVDQQTSVRVGHPFEARALVAFVATAPPDAEVSITAHMGGSQRDPEVTGYTLIARWTT